MGLRETYWLGAYRRNPWWVNEEAKEESKRRERATYAGTQRRSECEVVGEWAKQRAWWVYGEAVRAEGGGKERTGGMKKEGDDKGAGAANSRVALPGTLRSVELQ